VVIDKIYILHHSPLTDRKQYLLDRLKRNNITNYEFVEKFLPEEIIPNNILTIGELSLIKKHLYAIEDAKTNNYSNIIIFEDDIKLDCDFDIPTFIENVLAEGIEYDYDIIWIGGAKEYSTVTPHLVQYDKKYISRYTHGMLIHSSQFDIILNWFNNYGYNLALDHAYNKYIWENDVNSYWCYPYLEQRTATNELRSSLR